MVAPPRSFNKLSLIHGRLVSRTAEWSALKGMASAMPESFTAVTPSGTS
jgi:hypothetical protein